MGGRGLQGKFTGDVQSRDPRAGPKEEVDECQELSEGQPGAHVPAAPKAHAPANQPHCPAALAREGRGLAPVLQPSPEGRTVKK